MSEIDYHERRAAQERAAAGSARNAAVGNIHRGAEHHAARAASLRASARLRQPARLDHA